MLDRTLHRVAAIAYRCNALDGSDPIMSSVLEKITTDSKRRSKAYSAYYQREEPTPDAELTQTGAGTPLGEYMRRFWQPVCLSSQLTDVPHAIRIMGENLVAFRDREGHVGVLQRHCCHRGASLE